MNTPSGISTLRLLIETCFHIAILGFVLTPVHAQPPQTVTELWTDFDSRKDPLEVEVVREWKEDGGVFRYVGYLMGCCKSMPAPIAAS